MKKIMFQCCFLLLFLKQKKFFPTGNGIIAYFTALYTISDRDWDCKQMVEKECNIGLDSRSGALLLISHHST
jgi:hypothetical protein